MHQKITNYYIIQDKRIVVLLKIYGYECCAAGAQEFWYKTDFEIENRKPFFFPDGNALVSDGTFMAFYHREPLTMQSTINELWRILQETGKRDLANKIWDAIAEINKGE